MRSKTLEKKSMLKATTKQYGGKPQKENLIARISTKKSIGVVPDIDVKRVVATGIRTGGF